MGLKFIIESLDVFLERRKTRVHVGRLTSAGGQLIFTYDEEYLRMKNAFPLGPEFPLTKRQFKADTLFPSLEDRIPSQKNPAYPEYCYAMGIDPGERNPIVLLSTIGSKGPSSFVFVPVYRRSFSVEDVIAFRRSLGLTTREFAQIFEISQPALNALERKRSSGKDLLKRLEIIVHFPEVALYLLLLNGGTLQDRKKQHALSYLIELARSDEESDLVRFIKRGV